MMGDWQGLLFDLTWTVAALVFALGAMVGAGVAVMWMI